MNKTIHIGTRGSKLALYQAYRVKEELEAHFPDYVFEIDIIKTKGDKILDVPLSKIGDKGLFTKELETALFENKIDMAVHSLKDLPTTFPEGAKLGAVLKRGDIRDALASNNNLKLSELTENHVIATSSLRRKAQLLRRNKNFKIVEIRGNVNTRIRKMQEGYCDAMIMAGAGLQRLEMEEHISELIDPKVMIPACSQGAIAIEIRENDPFMEEILSKINHEDTWIKTQAERAFLKTLEGGCQIPVGSYSFIENDTFHITGFISSIDGSHFLQDTASGKVSQAVEIATQMAADLYKKGGDKILKSIRKINLQQLQGNTPLKNKVLISTRPKESENTFAEVFQNSGAEVLSLPMIEILPSPLSEGEKKLLHNLHSFQWLFFTSRNGVVHFFKQLSDSKGSTEFPASLKIAAIGSKTTKELDYYGYKPDFVSKGNTSEDFLNQFLEEINPENQKILLALGSLAEDILINGLAKNNRVTRINVYKTVNTQQVDSKIIQRIKQNNYDLLLFASPSAFKYFCSFFAQNELEKLKMASIGYTTTKAIEKAGCKPVLTAKKSNAEGLRDAIIEYYQS